MATMHTFKYPNLSLTEADAMCIDYEKVVEKVLMNWKQGAWEVTVEVSERKLAGFKKIERQK